MFSTVKKKFLPSPLIVEARNSYGCRAFLMLARTTGVIMTASAVVNPEVCVPEVK